jgi:hypothetical protein
MIKRIVMAAFLMAAGAAAFAAEEAVHREDIEWVDVWIPGNSVKDKPRVLLIGDSITRAYYDGVAARLKDKAVVARLATSSSVGDPALLAQVSMMLTHHKFDVIHFNNGLHGWDYTEEEYANHFPELLALLKKEGRGAKLIWASSTPIRNREKLEEFESRTERIKARNKIAAEAVTKEGIALDDLFSLVVDHPKYWSNDGVHFAADGVNAEADQVAKMIGEALPK